MADNNQGGAAVAMIQAAARIGVRLQLCDELGPMTMTDAARICAGGDSYCGLPCEAWRALDESERRRFYSRARGIIDSISLVGGLPIAEDDLHKPTVFFLLRL